MPDPKNNKDPEEELDAVSAAYESISKKLEELRKKREEDAESQDETNEADDDSMEEPDEQPDDEEESADEDEPVQTEIKQAPEPPKPVSHRENAELEPLPGTEDAQEELPLPVSKPPVRKQDDEDDFDSEEDPLDREDIPEEEPQGDHDLDDFDGAESDDEQPSGRDDQNENDESPVRETFVRNEEVRQSGPVRRSEDEMEKWEKAQSGEAEETIEPKPEINEEDNRSESEMNDGQPDSLDDLAAETLPPAGERIRPEVRREIPTQPPEFDEPSIRQIRPHHPSEQYEDFDNRPPQRESYDNFRREEQDPYGRRGRRKTGIWQLLVLGLIGLGVIGGTVYFLKYQFNGNPQPSPSTVVETPTPEPSATPMPTPAPQVNKSDYKVRVLNGTSTTGLAASVSAKLKGLGYQTERTGNATNSAFERTVIRVKEGSASSALIEAVIKDLAPEFSANGTPTLRTNEVVDIEVILGKQ